MHFLGCFCPSQVMPQHPTDLPSVLQTCIARLRQVKSTETFHTPQADFNLVGMLTLVQFLCQVSGCDVIPLCL